MSNDEPSAHEQTALQELLVTFSGNGDLHELDLNAPLRDVLDSLSHFSFLMAVEKSFGLSLSDESFTLHQMGTLNGILSTIRSQRDLRQASREERGTLR